MNIKIYLSAQNVTLLINKRTITLIKTIFKQSELWINRALKRTNQVPEYTQANPKDSQIIMPNKTSGIQKISY